MVINHLLSGMILQVSKQHQTERFPKSWIEQCLLNVSTDLKSKYRWFSFVYSLTVHAESIVLSCLQGHMWQFRGTSFFTKSNVTGLAQISLIFWTWALAVRRDTQVTRWKRMSFLYTNWKHIQPKSSGSTGHAPSRSEETHAYGTCSSKFSSWPLSRKPQIGRSHLVRSNADDVTCQWFGARQRSARGNSIHSNPICHIGTCFSPCKTRASIHCHPAGPLVWRNQKIPTCLDGHAWL